MSYSQHALIVSDGLRTYVATRQADGVWDVTARDGDPMDDETTRAVLLYVEALH
jgi:hypothetical protein